MALDGKALRRNFKLLLALAALAVILATSAAPAADRYWVYPGATGWWNNSAYWSATPGGPGGAGQPRTGDKVWLTQSDNLNRWVYFYTNYPSDIYDTIQVYSSGTGTMTFYVGVGSYNQTLRASELIVGGTQSTGKGNFRQDGWTTSLSTRLRLTNGSLLLKGGSFSAPQEVIGGQGPATFTQTGGSNILDGTNNTLILGEQANSSGTYQLSGTGYLRAQYQTIGQSGTGTFTQTGGSNILDGTSNTLLLGEQATGSGTYQLSNTGYLRSQYQTIGKYGTGTFTQTGGTNAVQHQLYLGYEANSHGTYELSGSASVDAPNLFVGVSGTGTFKQTGGSATGLMFSLGTLAGGSGTYELSGGAVQLLNLYVGEEGSALFKQSGGAVTLTGDNGLMLAGLAGSTGTYELSDPLAAGTRLNTTYSRVGVLGSGSFKHTGGSHVVQHQLYLGYEANSHGSYELSGNATLEVPNLFVGVSGTGTFKQNGGTASGLMFSLGTLAGGSGTYELSGGAVQLLNLFVGEMGHGHFKQSLGSVTLTGDNGLILAGEPGVTGTYELSKAWTPWGAGSSLTTTYSQVGLAGAGSFTQTGGSHTVSSDLSLAYYAGSTGAYTLQGGTLSVANTIVGLAGAGTFTQTGGSHRVNRNLVLASSPGSSGAYTLQGGTLRADVIQVNRGGAFTQQGGALSSIQFGSALTNYGNFTHQAGAFDIEFSNYGTAAFQGQLTSTRNFINYGQMNLSQSGSLTQNTNNTLPLTNQGTITLSGGALGGWLTNYGFIRGYGAIGGSGDFRNYAFVSQDGGDLTLNKPISSVSYNYGNLDLQAGRFLRLESGELSNLGTLNLNGAVLTGGGTLSNNGVIAGRGLIATPFTNYGTIQISEGTTFIGPNFLTSFDTSFDNWGHILLAGTTAYLQGGSIINKSSAGYLSGFGKVYNRIYNYGLVEASGGVLNLDTLYNFSKGVVTAGSGGTLLISTSAPSANEGLINLRGGSFTSVHFIFNETIGRINGYGTLNSPDIYNKGKVVFASGVSTVIGNFENRSGAWVEVNHAQTIFTGNFDNQSGGTMKNTGGLFTFLGSYTNNGTYTSDPATQTFTDLLVGATGVLRGGLGDYFLIQNDFLNRSTDSRAWNTLSAALHFTPGADNRHDFSLAGADLGAQKAGFLNNFAWGKLTLEGGQFLNLLDGNDTPGGALYVGAILGLAIDWQGRLITNVSGHGLNIYYDPLDPENAYLKGQTFAFLDGGHLAPAVVPLPGTVWLLLTGLAGVLGLRARRRF